MKAMFKLARPGMTAICLAMATTQLAQADQQQAAEAARQTTMALIETLVKSGVLTQEKADAIVKEAQQKAQQASANAPEAKPVVRVPYVSEAVRTQLRNEVKEEVLAQAREERWGVPNAPSWMDRIRIDGDLRYRHQSDFADRTNTSPQAYVNAVLGLQGRTTRAPDFSAFAVDSSVNDVPLASTQDDRDRERLRLRLSLTMKVADEVSVGVRLATGSTNDRVSTNQTLGQGFNKYPITVDRAFVRLDPAEWVTIQAGRIPNPWFSTEMVWSDNLNFEGLAATARWSRDDGRLVPFATVGWFPMREDTPGTREPRSLIGGQVGAHFEPSSRSKVRLGLAYYSYQNLAGRQDTAFELDGQGQSVVNPRVFGQYEYGAGLRQRGNTLFETGPTDIDPAWGLAYRFEPMVLTASAEFSHFAPFNLLVSAEYAKNMAFDLADFRERAGPGFASADPGGKDHGYMLKAAFGATDVREQGQWQVAASYRHVGSDAVLDAFTDSDLGLGGTNVEGYTLGLTYGLYRSTSVGVRYLSSKSIDSTINNSSEALSRAKFNVNSLQVDFNVRF